MKLTHVEDNWTVWPDGWVQVKIPLPFSLRWVNSYLLPEQDGYTLIDPGLHTPEAEALWLRLLREHAIDIRSINRIVLTHQHPDHYGLAGWFQQRTGAPVYMSGPSCDYARRLWGGDRTFDKQLSDMYASHGMDREPVSRMAPHLESFVQLVSPQPEVRLLALDGTIHFGRLEWEIVHTPGHANGHLCFYHRASKRIVCGDQVLPDITPNVSVVPGEDEDPLRAFLASLEKLSRLEADMAFPGHRNPFSDFSGRIDELRQHHDRRLDLICGWLDRPVTAYEVCERLFGERIQGNTHNLRFAMSESLAHLNHLVGLGKARTETDGGIIRFRA